MGVPTYLPIANITMGGTVNTLSFSNITQQYRDLVMVVNSVGATLGVGMRFNGDSSTSYSRVLMGGNGTNTVTNASTNPDVGLNYWNALSSNGAVSILNIMDYSATDKHKTVLHRTGSVSSDDNFAAATRWPSNTAITSISFVTNGPNFGSGTTFTLYGVLA